MSDTIITAEQAKKLASLIKRYADTQVALSWKGSQPISYWEAIEDDAASASEDVKLFISLEFGREVKL